MMWLFVLIPFFLQAVAILVDEVYFHWKRGLPRWERIGHPLDTLSLLVCLAMVVFVPFSPMAFKIYIALSVISCLMVTKDEFVHKHHCPAAENWLHALLFILHPITLAVTGVIWPFLWNVEMPAWVLVLLDNPAGLSQFIHFQAGAIFLFFLYQIIFWNFIWDKQPVQKH